MGRERNGPGLRIDDGELGAVVEALGGSAASLTHGYSVAPVNDLAHGGFCSATGGVWRVEGRGDAPSRFSAIVKVIHHSGTGSRYWLSSDRVADPMYWRREPLAYASGLTRSFGESLRGPRLLGTSEEPDGGVRLWLEDVQALAGRRWSIDQYAVAARLLGRAQAPFLAGRSLPSDPWLSRRWLESYLERRAPDLVPPPPSAWGAPLVRRHLARDLGDRSQELWARRSTLLGALRRLAPMVCHLDFWPNNLFLDGPPDRPALVAIDWAFVGIGSLGEDAGNLVADSMLDLFVDARTSAEALTDAVVAGYGAGLSDGGARVPPGDVRFAVFGFASLKYVWMTNWLVRAAADSAEQKATEERFGVPFESVYARRAAAVRHLARLAEEAWRLVPGLTA